MSISYPMGMRRDDYLHKKSKNHYVFWGCFDVCLKHGTWDVTSVDDGQFVCTGETLDEALTELEKRLDPNYAAGPGVYA